MLLPLQHFPYLAWTRLSIKLSQLDIFRLSNCLFFPLYNNIFRKGSCRSGIFHWFYPSAERALFGLLNESRHEIGSL